MYPFKSGISRILERTPVPVIPVALQGLWGSLFSRMRGRSSSRLMKKGLLSKIGLVASAPVAPANATPEFLQQQVLQLRGSWQ
jgi:1-acyl-sn-glycerol-3-phosphate acyltransferase